MEVKEGWEHKNCRIKQGYMPNYSDSSLTTGGAQLLSAILLFSKNTLRYACYINI